MQLDSVARVSDIVVENVSATRKARVNKAAPVDSRAFKQRDSEKSRPMFTLWAHYVRVSVPQTAMEWLTLLVLFEQLGLGSSIFCVFMAVASFEWATCGDCAPASAATIALGIISLAIAALILVIEFSLPMRVPLFKASVLERPLQIY